MWIQELANALSLELNDFGKELFVESKQQALSLKINLPVIPRIRYTVPDEEVQSFYTNVFKQVFDKAASSLLCYQSICYPLSIAIAANVKFITLSC